jgi:hypothetical protein
VASAINKCFSDNVILIKERDEWETACEPTEVIEIFTPMIIPVEIIELYSQITDFIVMDSLVTIVALVELESTATDEVVLESKITEELNLNSYVKNI